MICPNVTVVTVFRVKIRSKIVTVMRSIWAFMVQLAFQSVSFHLQRTVGLSNRSVNMRSLNVHRLCPAFINSIFTKGSYHEGFFNFRISLRVS